MDWINKVPSWLFSLAFLAIVILFIYLALSGKELHYKDSIKFVSPDVEMIDSEFSNIESRIKPLENKSTNLLVKQYSGKTNNDHSAITLAKSGGKNVVSASCLIGSKNVNPHRAIIGTSVVGAAGSIPYSVTTHEKNDHVYLYVHEADHQSQKYQCWVWSYY